MPNFLILDKLGTDTVWALVVPGAAGFGVFFMRQLLPRNAGGGVEERPLDGAAHTHAR